MAACSCKWRLLPFEVCLFHSPPPSSYTHTHTLFLFCVFFFFIFVHVYLYIYKGDIRIGYYYYAGSGAVCGLYISVRRRFCPATRPTTPSHFAPFFFYLFFKLSPFSSLSLFRSVTCFSFFYNSFFFLVPVSSLSVT